VLITDLGMGIWYVQKEGDKTKTQHTVTKEGSVIYFNALPGKYLIYR